MFLWGIAGVNSVIMILSIYPMLIGPWLWMGEVPAALRKFVEAKIE